MKYFIYQGNDHDCGFTALKMYLAILAKDKSYLYIPKPVKRERYDLDELVLLGKKYDAELETYGCTKDYYDYLEVPSIALIDENHAVVIKKRKKNHIILYDPSKGKVKMNRDEFLRRWRNVIVFSKNENSILKIDKIRQHLLPPKLINISNFLALFSTIVLISTFYLLNRSENFIFSIIFLALFVLFQILEKLLLYKQVYIFDKNYIPLYFEKKKNNTKEKYTEYVSYKKQFFDHNRHFLLSILIAFCITFLLCFNDFRNVFVLLALILLKMLESIVFSKIDKSRENEVAEYETEIFKNADNVKELALKANLKADGHVFTSSIKEIFYIFASFIFALTMMFVTGTSGCNFVIFHFVMYYAGLNSYNQFLISFSNRKEIQKLEQRFYDSCNL